VATFRFWLPLLVRFFFTLLCSYLRGEQIKEIKIGLVQQNKQTLTIIYLFIYLFIYCDNEFTVQVEHTFSRLIQFCSLLTLSKLYDIILFNSTETHVSLIAEMIDNRTINYKPNYSQITSLDEWV